MPNYRQKRIFLGEIGEDLAITGPDGEMEDVTEGRHFLYYFDDTYRDLPIIVEDGAVQFASRFGHAPSMVILSGTYGLERGHRVAGLAVIPVPDIPPYHFWFGPKPAFYQARFEFE